MLYLCLATSAFPILFGPSNTNIEINRILLPYHRTDERDAWEMLLRKPEA